MKRGGGGRREGGSEEILRRRRKSCGVGGGEEVKVLQLLLACLRHLITQDGVTCATADECVCVTNPEMLLFFVCFVKKIIKFK
jgi:hypothetical protein